MAAYLSQEWLDDHLEAGAALPTRPGASARVQHVVTGAPDGEVRYHVTITDGRPVAAELGDATEVDLTFTATYPEAQRAARGEVGPHEAFMQGRLKVVGSTGRLMDLMPMLDSEPYREAIAAVSASTEY
jgi:alkyl sulfatase BDS1-like metallo-beta-lactamase superfamily hydrolase